MRKFDSCLTRLHVLWKTFPENEDVEQDMERAQERLTEQQTGVYSSRKMYEQTKATNLIVDAATFVGPVEI